MQAATPSGVQVCRSFHGRKLGADGFLHGALLARTSAGGSLPEMLTRGSGEAVGCPRRSVSHVCSRGVAVPGRDFWYPGSCGGG